MSFPRKRESRKEEKSILLRLPLTREQAWIPASAGMPQSVLYSGKMLQISMGGRYWRGPRADYPSSLVSPFRVICNDGLGRESFVFLGRNAFTPTMAERVSAGFRNMRKVRRKLPERKNSQAALADSLA